MSSETRNETFARYLTVLLGIFIFRVAAQLIQAIYPVHFLPAFDSWQSGALPYPVLVVSQIAVIGVCVRAILRIRLGTVTRSERAAKIYFLLGGIYLLVMLARLVAGFTFAVEHPWLGAHLPTFFHLVLATFLIVIGLFHSHYGRSLVAWMAYPGIIAIAICAHFVCLQNGINLMVSTYAPVLTGALAITFLERMCWQRQAWLASFDDVLTDTVYMLLVQILLPRFLAFFVAVTILNEFSSNEIFPVGIWPHNLPVFLQALLMLVTAEFFRYWLHRLAHQWPPLWRFHAVHHSPHKLYWINVGRFHPIEKALQFLFDSLPFIVFGVSAEVLALYFVFYSLNGFFQHCNIELRLGLLNYLVSGPELHRWHHSRSAEESNNNYGNNLIIWDLLFGTWFLPKDRLVGKLGLINRHYPLGFISQLRAPFIKGLDKASQ
ncbi:MAG: sterol desaturase family protein [Gammaproteobacteria bacterium]